MKHPSDADFEWTNDRTLQVAIMHAETDAGIRWVLNYFATVYRFLSMSYDLETIIAHFTETMSKGVKEEEKYWGKLSDIDYRQLFFSGMSQILK